MEGMHQCNELCLLFLRASKLLRLRRHNPVWDPDSYLPLVLLFCLWYQQGYWLWELAGREAIPLPQNPIAWRDKPLADAMSPGTGSRLQLPCHFFRHIEEKKLSHIWESLSKGLTNDSLMAQKACCYFDSKIRGSFLPHFVALYKGFVSNEKLGIQIWQNSVSPKNSWICLLVVRVGIEQKAWFLSALRFHWS
jgi:hypothetical protein